MARKRTKKEAKERIRSLPFIPELQLPIGGPTIGEIAEVFVDADPLDRLAPDPIERMVNDPSFKLSADQVDLINNDNRMVARLNGEMVEVPAAAVRTRSRDRRFELGQFDRSRILPRSRSRKKTKTDKNMSKALEEANRRLRTQKGKLRKGKTQADIMRLAHRLRKKM